MTYVAHVLRVMIASPTDVGPERRIIRDVISDWNATNTVDRRVVSMPIVSPGWPKPRASLRRLVVAAKGAP
jgi:hypothetical protein